MAIPKKLDQALKAVAGFDYASHVSDAAVYVQRMQAYPYTNRDKMWVDEYANIPMKSFNKLSKAERATMMSNAVLHQKLKDKLVYTLDEIKQNMIARFSVLLPYDEMQDILISDKATHWLMQAAGRDMAQQYTHYSYRLGEKVTINLSCRGGKEMPAILFPSSELTNFSEEFLDIVRPLYLITKSWMDVQLAFEAVCRLLQDTREFNFYVPWLRHIIPNDLANEYNGPYRISQWLGLDNERHAVIEMIARQVRYIVNNEYTNKRTWMPSDLVHMVRQGEELITQYNIMKSVAVPNISLKEDYVSVEMVLTVKDHPTIKWASEASTHRTINEVQRIREADDLRYLKSIREGS